MSKRSRLLWGKFTKGERGKEVNFEKEKVHYKEKRSKNLTTD